MDVFIVRPFGNRKVLQKDTAGNQVTVEFNFDLVQEELMMPALKKVGLTGGTTGLIFESGSIHEDMFSLLLVADLVIADLSIHNANVFYELGIRHALRDKRTVLIKCPGFDETPFDILGFRYITYKKDEPSSSIAELVQALDETIKANRNDSPVFKALDKLESQDPERFLAIPEDFEVDLRITTAQKNAAKLAMMASEISGFPGIYPDYVKLEKRFTRFVAWSRHVLSGKKSSVIKRTICRQMIASQLSISDWRKQRSHPTHNKVKHYLKARISLLGTCCLNKKNLPLAKGGILCA